MSFSETMERLAFTLFAVFAAVTLCSAQNPNETRVVLILDDLFIVPLDAKERPILLEIIEDRHERKSVIITSQYPSSNWYDMVGDPTIADAILDRIIHTAHTIELYGESMRKLKSKKNENF